MTSGFGTCAIRRQQLLVSVTGETSSRKSVLLSFCFVLGQEDQAVNLSHLNFEMLRTHETKCNY